MDLSPVSVGRYQEMVSEWLSCSGKLRIVRLSRQQMIEDIARQREMLTERKEALAVKLKESRDNLQQLLRIMGKD